ncbi:succinate-semialdehyde dehydrogenase (NADP(+)) [Variovorax sp. WS11]|uniref:NAD-dependent succinate-semialdehyde dehydrogenase n=1 Tax=Variovorax sp. WS11 TaxID=1105204 RepID=UPI000D0C9813|nr:NAD-dependent succinate-semialdehyde dehydrogenase [Variovorax sp. WS11]NDZ12454.1 NAD-dependent succinate-semialdehyde dehydrogenase [Variovorax sp. WS11]PSL85299.1 succinate-semialdehyde dehydrogenase (NADP(+)) [Variovorax sp. WS11]
MTLNLERQDLMPGRQLIGAEWREASDARRLDVTDPATDAVFASVPDGTAADARAAVDAAHAAFPAWRAVPAKQRAQIIKRWNDLVMAHQEDLGRLISREQGKPLAEGRGEVAYAASYIEWFAEEATRANGDVIPAPVTGRRMFALKEPVGVVATITPWNFPAAMIARKIAPALAAGCTVVCKPAEDTPLTSLALVKLAQEAGVPAGVINIVTASRERTPEVVDVWLDDARVRKISFTGSTPVGQHLARRSADTLKKLSLELGGNAPFIVFDDADIDAAVEGLMAAKFRNGGQTCVSPNRVFVQAGVHDAFVDKLAGRVGALQVGPASDTASQIGPMINARALEKIERHVRDAIERGAKVLAGGKRLVDLGPNYYAPTVLVNADASMECSCEETFGPVVPITRFDSEAEVIAAANDTPFGLAAYFYSQDVRRIWRVAEALETGIVGVNEGALAAEAAPFGGVKASGYGREGSVHGLDDYLHIKYVCQGGLS